MVKGPDAWRHDHTERGCKISYIGVGDHWWMGTNGVLGREGTIKDAQVTRLTEGDNLCYGRPYLTPQENAWAWWWINPQLWASSLNLIVDNYRSDEVYTTPNIVHVLAGYGWDHGMPLPEWGNRWWLNAPDRDVEITDYTTFFQLWVDMKTGFFRRIAAEGTNGRQMDMVIKPVVVNHPKGIAPKVFEWNNR